MIKDSVRALCGGAVVYLMVVACGGSDSAGPATLIAEDDGGFGGAPAEQTKTQEPVDSGIFDTLADSLAHPVKDAVAADAPQVSGGTRLKPRWQVGEDGSKQFVGWYDTEKKESCAFFASGDGQQRCLPHDPANAGFAGYYYDNKCSEPLAYKLSTQATCSSVDPKYALAATQDACANGRYKVYQITSRFQGATYYKTENGCASITPSATMIFYRITEVPLASFVAAQVQVGD